MEQNIKTKDVQRTEYLDKNGLDVLWAKVKENTNNQVEVERNRAVAKENSITNSLGQFVSKTATDEQFLESRLTAYSGFYVKSRVNGDYSGASLYIENRTKPCLNMIDFGQSITSELTPSKLKLAYDGDRSITITRDGITNPDNNSNHVSLQMVLQLIWQSILRLMMLTRDVFHTIISILKEKFSFISLLIEKEQS